MADESRPYQLYWYKAASSLAPMAVLEETGAARGGAGAGTSRHSRRIVSGHRLLTLECPPCAAPA